jgi:hypothetical protein
VVHVAGTIAAPGTVGVIGTTIAPIVIVEAYLLH